MHIQTFENHPKVRQKLSVNEISHTAIYSAQLSIYQYEMLILVYTELYRVYRGMAELSRWSGFQMDGSTHWHVQVSRSLTRCASGLPRWGQGRHCTVWAGSNGRAAAAPDFGSPVLGTRRARVFKSPR